MSFFKEFYEELAPASDEMMRLSKDLMKHINLDMLETAAITERYPAFYDVLGFSLLVMRQAGIQYDPPACKRKVNKLLKLIEALDLSCLRGKIAYNVSFSIMKPKSYIDWHYDAHTRSMICERIHIPVVTNEHIMYYSKWFSEPIAYEYKLPLGSIYRLNNRVPHAVENPHDESRTHLLIDYVDSSVLDYVQQSNRIDSWMFDELAPVEPNHPSYTFIGRSKAKARSHLKLFNYTRQWVHKIGTVLPAEERNVWLTADESYLNVIESYK